MADTETAAETVAGKTRHLVVHDYGMGGVWWWVWAASAEEIPREVAEVEVVTDPETRARAAEWGLEEVHLDAPGPDALSSLRAQREAQRGEPGFGALAGRERVYLRWQEDGEGSSLVCELGPDGRRLRQVEVAADGSSVRTTPEDWLFNPPMDLWDPRYASWETGAEEFEAAWRDATPG
ncbi:hypothetical protein [Streptomyces lichenis]|uniref:Uncharacterized protein n=1 Tax=Streptomyces lichenis TaxID=2306967 RepID=A0ABT0ICW3_9ACTN|nr:hypothetical protein [Streptomyces lichenis]MCK8679158.1 hypothetical protein [Streptomyces lichenis]